MKSFDRVLRLREQSGIDTYLVYNRKSRRQVQAEHDSCLDSQIQTGYQCDRLGGGARDQKASQ